jgi:hypothetical protein
MISLLAILGIIYHPSFKRKRPYPIGCFQFALLIVASASAPIVGSLSYAKKATSHIGK